MAHTKLDANQVLKDSFVEDKDALRVLNIGALIPEDYDEIDLTYVASGNGTGQIQTVTYSLAGQQVAMLTLSYDSSDRLIKVQEA